MPYSANDIEDDILTLTGAGRVQTDDVDVSIRVARHRRGRSMEDDPSGYSASPDYGQAASPPCRRVTRSKARGEVNPSDSGEVNPCRTTATVKGLMRKLMKLFGVGHHGFYGRGVILTDAYGILWSFVVDS
ncbi:hypothetical protein Salat_0660300 [Sesamum alatum]|uniref:Uncharacterized protein n=1 Tax=Sesamum alatum TaxID=300844 RepID=A0AAE2CUI9_9LAMI|nr:hypothetical protein Salat_0660300 [Sesamum alatum]